MIPRLTCGGRVDGAWLTLTHCLDKRDHDAHPVDDSDGDVWLTGAQAATRASVAAATWRSYVSRGYAPKPDDADEGRPPQRRNPRWLASTVDHFTANRLKQGTRTDLQGEGESA